MGSIKTDESLYLFEADEEERARLNNQHRVLVHIIDKKILHAPIDASAITNVVDVGTGTGIWLDALAAHLDPPAASKSDQRIQRHYDGLDMTAAHFPSPRVHPDNFAYDVWNILHPVPEDRKGKYDLVHVRLLAAAFARGQVATAVDNLVQLLRPGGWIQWEELDGETWAGRVQSPHVREMNELGRKSMEARGWEMQ
ncbi:class I SAM-dependent methyltransferase [Aspergillus stella-maris]|uniref:class I SAM-dependent methyltransferase n=1 Tax=Aspergillus stella-maris TaxID=1810926 RepID=UPI003CCCE00A